MKNFKNSLSRNEMKSIYAGKTPGTLPFSVEGSCTRNADCWGGVGYCCTLGGGAICQGQACSPD